jgi:hypothetical protein
MVCCARAHIREFNVNCVMPFPHTAPSEVARLVYERLRAPTKGIA